MQKRSLITAGLVVGFVLSAMGGPAVAAVSPQQAEALKTTLTPFGAERAGSADGEIPAWTGAPTALPAGFDVKTMDRPDPFAAEKPLLSITASNLQHYAPRLEEGALELFRRNPSYRIDVYRTHRTALAPQWVYDNTFRNATSAQLAHGGNAVVGAFGGIPFPIPQSGGEAVWNHQLHWQGVAIYLLNTSYVVTGDGAVVLTSHVEGGLQFPYYDKNAAPEVKGAYELLRANTIEPAYQNGQAVIGYQMLDPIDNGSPGWQYLPGQRRVRKSPDLAYDTPNFANSGVVNFDEFGLFLGPPDRFNWSIVGKREMYVPYNVNRLFSTTAKSLLEPKFPNPDMMRWELHRVWIVEGHLATGARHVVHLKRLYLDEDTWQAVAEDEYDASGQLWKFGIGLPAILPDFPATFSPSATVFWDFHAGNYVAQTYLKGDRYYPISPLSMDDWTPEALATAGSR